MKRATSYIVLIFAMVMLTQACASSQPTLSFEPGAIDTDKYVRKVDQFVVIADGSLSMTDRWQRQRVHFGTFQRYRRLRPWCQYL